MMLETRWKLGIPLTVTLHTGGVASSILAAPIKKS